MKGNEALYEITNRFTQVRWWARQPVAWRPPRQWIARPLRGDELRRAEATDPDLVGIEATTVEWTTDPDLTAPPLHERAHHHAFVGELAELEARVDGMLELTKTWPTPEQATVDPWEAATWLATLVNAKGCLARARRCAESWHAEWPPDVTKTGFTLGSTVRAGTAVLERVLPGELTVVGLLLDGQVLVRDPQGSTWTVLAADLLTV